MTTKIKYSEEEMVGLLQSSDQQSFSVLYDSYSRALLGVIKKMVFEDEAAEDVLQEVFIKIWNNRSMYDAAKGRLYTWMLNIARNKSIDYLRSPKNKFNTQIQRGENTVYAIDRNNNVETSVDHIGLKVVLDQLDKGQRELIDLVYFQGYTQEEISKKLEMPLGSVKTKVRSTLISLRKRIT